MIIRIPFLTSESAFLILLLAAVFLCAVPCVRSDSSVIKLPTQNGKCYEIEGSNGGTGSCPVKCFRADPVCGVDGVTYWCGCQEARCAGIKVAKKGFCEVGNNGAAAQVMLLVHILWLVILGISVVFGFF